MSQFLRLIQSGESAKVADAVEDNPALAEYRDPQGVSALMWSIYVGQPMVRDFLLQKLAERNVELDIFEAAAIGEDARLGAILESQPELAQEFTSDGWTPLHLAAAFGTPAAVELLLEHGARVDIVSKNPQCNQPLHAVLALSRNREIIETLLAHGADADATQVGGFTAIFSAASANRKDLAQLLIEHGADPRHVNDQGKTPGAYARERGFAELADWLDSVPRP